MKLLTLALRNFRQHSESLIDFGDGVTGIIGPNGAGKTTIVEALAFAFFGSRALRGKVDDLRTRFAPRTAHPSVELRCEHEGVVLRIVRSTNDAALFVGGESNPVATGTRDVTGRISQILGMSFEEFFATYFTEQKGLEFLSATKGASDRERFIIRMMGYDKLERVQESLRGDKRDRRQELVGREAALGSRESIVARLEKERTELAAKQSTLDEYGQVLRHAERQEESAKRVLDELTNARTAYQELKRACEVCELKGKEAGRRLENLRTRVAALTKAHLPAGSEPTLDEVGRQREALAQRKAQLEQEFETRAAALQALEVERQESRAEREAERRAALLEEERLGKALKSLERLDGQQRCPTCSQTIGSETHLAVKQLTEQLTEARSRREQLEQALSVALQPSEEHEAVTQLRDELVKLGVMEKAFGGLHLALQDLRQQSEELEAEVQRSNSKGQKLQQSLAALEFSEELYISRRGDFEAKQRLTEVARLQRVRCEGDLQALKALLDRTSDELGRHDEQAASTQVLRKELLVLEETDQVLTEVRKALSMSVRPRLAALAGEFVTELTDARYTEVRVSDDYAPQLVEDGLPKAVISGGEEDILNLSMRLALSQLIADRAGQHFSMLVLDEVFGSLDEQRRTNVLQLLEKLSSRFEQIILITHFDDLKEALQNLVYVDYDAASNRAVVGGLDSEFDQVVNI